jgi:hypothetical protein
MSSTRAMNTGTALCDEWGIWDTKEQKWAHTETGSERAARNGAMEANSTRNPWSSSTRYEARRYTPTNNPKVLPPMPTLLDQRRLRDGARALASSEPSGSDVAAWRAHVEALGDAVAAMQSLDDLGSTEANNQAWSDMLALQEKWEAAKAQLRVLESTPTAAVPIPGVYVRRAQGIVYVTIVGAGATDREALARLSIGPARP